MYTATAGIVLPTTIIGSLPRPTWYTENLGRRNFREAMVDRFYREQYLARQNQRAPPGDAKDLDGLKPPVREPTYHPVPDIA